MHLLTIGLACESGFRVCPFKYPPRAVSRALTHAQELGRLNDVWFSQPNTAFAKNLFTRDDWLSAVPPPVRSHLCEVCAQFDISQPSFEMSDSIGSIRFRARTCELCELFSKVYADLSVPSQKFSCFRAKSTLYMKESSHPILSIYADPGKLLYTAGPVLVDSDM